MKSTFLRRLCAVIIGIVFLVSGLLKIIDPVGTMLIVTEYAKFLHLGFMIPAAKVLGIILAAVEALTGLMLITGVLRKLAAWITYILLGVFTVITLILWIANPVMDCGCFGEAVHLTHAQSFLKNIVLLALALAAFLPLRTIGKPKGRKWISFTIAAASVVLAIIYSNTHIPIVDFTEYDFGTELFASLEDDVEADNHYEPAFVYEKDGQRGTFPISNLPDSTWTFVEADTLFRESIGMKPEHPVLSFYSSDGSYQDRLAAEGKVVVFSVYDPARANWDRLHRQYMSIEDAGGTALLLVASYPEEIDSFGVPIDLPVFYADYKTLITLNRSNGGGTYLDEGEIIHKWHERDFPHDLGWLLGADPIDLSTHCILKRRLKAQGFCLYLAALLILV